MVNLSKGSISKQPIQTQVGWYVIKVENKRSFQMPTFEDEKLKIEMFLKQKKKMDYIKKLKIYYLMCLTVENLDLFLKRY